MSDLPDEIWAKILELGVKTSNITNNHHLTFKDLCCISISCKRLHRLSNDHSLWSSLFSIDFPLRLSNNSNNNINNNTSSSISSKSLYKLWYEKDKAKRIARYRRTLLRIECRIAEHSRNLEELRVRREEEGVKLKAVVDELSYLRNVRQASIALNVWQPEVIRGRQKEIVEQCAVPVDSRINALEMELKLCKQHVLVFEKTYRDENQRYEETKVQLMSMKYHPLQDFSVFERRMGDSSVKRKKLKLPLTADDETKSKV